MWIFILLASSSRVTGASTIVIPNSQKEDEELIKEQTEFQQLSQVLK
jgi:hypothetical protein